MHGKTNVNADTLYHVPEHMQRYVPSCTTETSHDELRAIIKSRQLQDEADINWVSLLTNNPSVADRQKSPPDTQTAVALKDIRRAKTTDEAIQ